MTQSNLDTQKRLQRARDEKQRIADALERHMKEADDLHNLLDVERDLRARSEKCLKQARDDLQIEQNKNQELSQKVGKQKHAAGGSGSGSSSRRGSRDSDVSGIEEELREDLAAKDAIIASLRAQILQVQTAKGATIHKTKSPNCVYGGSNSSNFRQILDNFGFRCGTTWHMTKFFK